MQTGKVPINLRRFMDYLGQDHLTGVLYGLVNLIVCVPSLVSYAHIVFPQAEFLQFMPAIVKIYFLSSAVMQLAMTLLSSIVSLGSGSCCTCCFCCAHFSHHHHRRRRHATAAMATAKMAMAATITGPTTRIVRYC
ncbi:unnamed protein product [Symbiodinium sp. CCMP2456]|nr:unnamed protein product [Symbiodinium sp. CCMP2456]